MKIVPISATTKLHLPVPLNTKPSHVTLGLNAIRRYDDSKRKISSMSIEKYQLKLMFKDFYI
jgi:hypothetical protein